MPCDIAPAIRRRVRAHCGDAGPKRSGSWTRCLRQAPGLFQGVDPDAVAALAEVFEIARCAAAAHVALPRGRAGRPAVRRPDRQGQAGPRVRRRPARTCSPSWARRTCSASCRCSTPVRAPPPRPRSPTPAGQAGARRLQPVDRRPPGDRRAAAAGAGPPAAPDQRLARRPDLHRRARPGGQGAAAAGRPVRRPATAGCGSRTT